MSFESPNAIPGEKYPTPEQADLLLEETTGDFEALGIEIVENGKITREKDELTQQGAREALTLTELEKQIDHKGPIV